MLNEETEFPEVNSHACPWGQTLPFVIRTAPRLERYPRPAAHAARAVPARRRAARARPEAAGRSLRRHAGVGCATRWRRPTPRRRRSATRSPRPGARRSPTSRRRASSASSIIGRPYNMYDKGVNMDIPRKLRTFYGVNVIPMDFLPLKGIEVRDIVPNMYWNYGRKILQAAQVRRRPRAAAHHLPDELQVRPRLLHQALHPGGLGQALPHAAVRRAPERRRRHDSLRGLSRQQGLPALVVPGRRRRACRRVRTRRRRAVGRARSRRRDSDVVEYGSLVVTGDGRGAAAGAADRSPGHAGDPRLRPRGPHPVPAAHALRRHATCWPPRSARSASTAGPRRTPTTARSSWAARSPRARSATRRRSPSATSCA